MHRARTLLVGLLLVLPTAPAQALCVSRPDTAASHYVENNTAQTLCLNGEVADTAARLAAEARLRALEAESASARRQQVLPAAPAGGMPQAAW